MAEMRWWEVEAVVVADDLNPVIDGGDLEAPVTVSNQAEILTDGTFGGDLEAPTTVSGRLEVTE